MSKKQNKVGLVLGGGGAKAFAHLGVVDVLKEHGINIDLIVACSGGAIFGALIANNIESDDIKKVFFKRKYRTKWFFPKLSRKGLISTKNIEHILNNFCKDAVIEESCIPICIATTNLNSGKLCIFKEGSLTKAVCASMAFPGMYAPVEIDGQLFVDGGVLNSIPADVCREQVGDDGVVISINLDEMMEEEIDGHNMLSVVYRSIYISLFHKRKNILEENSDIVLNIFADSKFNFKSWREILTFYSVAKMNSFYNLGRQKAIENIDIIKKAIDGLV